ncbi:MAG: hypothetical protein ACKOUS_06280, partial [Alphaproteobacteria bacterium]
MSDEPGSTGDEAAPAAAPHRAHHRSSARLAAVQALFQVAERGIDAQAVVDVYRSHRLSDADVGEGQPDLSNADRRHFAAIVLGASIRAVE